MLTSVHQPGHNLVKRVHSLLVEGHNPLDFRRIQAGGLGLGDPEELRVVGRHILHVILDAIQSALLRLVHIAEETRGIVVDLYASRRQLFELSRGIDEGLAAFLIEGALGAHAADDTAPTDCHVGILVGNENRGADGLIAASGGVRPIDGSQNGKAHLLQLGMAEKGRSTSSAIGIDQMLLGELDAAAVDQPDEGHVQTLGHVRHAQDIFRLPCDPGTGHHLVVEADDNGPLAGDFPQTVNDAGGAFFILHGIIKGVEGTPGAGVHQVFQALPDGHLSALVDFLLGKACILDALNLFGQQLLHLLDLFNALGGIGHLSVGQRTTEFGHFFEIRLHRYFSSSGQLKGIELTCRWG